MSTNISKEIELLVWKDAQFYVEGFKAIDPDLRVNDIYAEFLEDYKKMSAKERDAYYHKQREYWDHWEKEKKSRQKAGLV